jgi:hypothetical protein
MTNKHLLGQQELCCVVSYKPITGQYCACENTCRRSSCNSLTCVARAHVYADDNPEGPVLPDYADEYAAMVGA